MAERTGERGQRSGLGVGLVGVIAVLSSVSPPAGATRPATPDAQVLERADGTLIVRLADVVDPAMANDPAVVEEAMADALVTIAAQPTAVAAADAEHLDRLVEVQDARGRPLAVEPATPAPEAGAADLTFTYNTSEPWGAGELAEVQADVSACYDALRDLLGPPSARSTPVNIRKDTSLSYSGLYFANSNEIVLRVPDTGVICHELAHAFRGVLYTQVSSFEEGMARAAEVMALHQIHSGAGPRPSEYVFYDLLNDHAIGSTRGNLFAGFVGIVERYGLAGAAWTKVLIEHPAFLADFNAALFEAAAADPTVRNRHAALYELAEAAAPQVEGWAFADWYSRQAVLNPNPPTGLQLHLRPATNAGYVFSRSGVVSGPNESMHPMIPVTPMVTTYAGDVLDASPTETSSAGVFLFSAISPASPGRITHSASATVGSDTVSRAVHTLRQDWIVGVSGVSPRNVGGTVTITPMAPAGPSVEVPLVDGAFQAPTLADFRGRLQVSVVYDDGLAPLTRTINKESGPVAVLLAEPPLPPPGPPIEPSPPRGLTVTRGPGSATLTWQPPASNGGAEVNEYRVSRDGSVINPSSAATIFTDAGRPDGSTATYHVTAVNAHGESWRTPNVSVVIDAAAPLPRLLAPSARWTLSPPTNVEWAATDPEGSGVGDHDVQQRRAAYNRTLPATWASLRTETTSTAAPVSTVLGTTHCFRVRSRDLVGNVSGFTPARCTVVPLPASRLTYRGPWATRSVAAAFEGSTRVATARGASATLTGIRAERVALVVTRCPSCGSVRVRWNGGSPRVLSLTGSTTARRQVVAAYTFGAVRTGTLTVEVTTSGRSVQLEGVGVYKD